MQRRSVLTAMGLCAVAAAATPAAAEPMQVPVIWDGKKMWDTFSENAIGFSKPGRAGRARAYVAFDTQCSDCIRLLKHIRPLLDDIDVVWCPVAFMGIHSEPQGATMLASRDPWAKFVEHHDTFVGRKPRGITYDARALSEEVRTAVWTNTKLHRRCGCRSVPFGVFKNSRGEYCPFDNNLTRDELKKLFELR